MSDRAGDDQPLVQGPRRKGLLVALVATMIAVPLIAYDTMSGDDDPASPSPTTVPMATVIVAPDRPVTGPPKGISVVTSSTTSSTLPLTTTTTTTTVPAVRFE